MNKKEFILGLIIGIVAAALGSYLFLLLFSNYASSVTIAQLKSEGILGKIITLGALLNLVLFFVFLKLKKENIAKGIVMATLLLAFTTFLL
jgi:hypothetical protein